MRSALLIRSASVLPGMLGADSGFIPAHPDAFASSVAILKQGSDFTGTFQNSHDSGFILSASAGHSTLTFIEAHIPRLAPDEGFVDLALA
jgi:hypothetical protein